MGYRGHDETESTVYIAGQQRGIKTQRLKQSLKRRQAIEPVIGHLKSDGLLGRNHLKGTEGDQLNVLLSCAGHNLRLILRRLRFFYLEKEILILAWLRLWNAPRRAVCHGCRRPQWRPETGFFRGDYLEVFDNVDMHHRNFSPAWSRKESASRIYFITVAGFVCLVTSIILSKRA